MKFLSKIEAAALNDTQRAEYTAKCAEFKAKFDAIAKNGVIHCTADITKINSGYETKDGASRCAIVIDRDSIDAGKADFVIPTVPSVLTFAEAMGDNMAKELGLGTWYQLSILLLTHSDKGSVAFDLKLCMAGEAYDALGNTYTVTHMRTENISMELGEYAQAAIQKIANTALSTVLTENIRNNGKKAKIQSNKPDALDMDSVPF